MTKGVRVSVSIPPEIGMAVRASALRHGTSVSQWLAAAASAQLRNELAGTKSEPSEEERALEFARLEARQEKIQAGVEGFTAGDRISRDDLHRRGGH